MRSTTSYDVGDQIRGEVCARGLGKPLCRRHPTGVRILAIPGPEIDILRQVYERRLQRQPTPRVRGEFGTRSGTIIVRFRPQGVDPINSQLSRGG